MPTRPVPLDMPVPDLAPTVPSHEPVDSLAPNCFEDDEQDEDDPCVDLAYEGRKM